MPMRGQTPMPFISVSIRFRDLSVIETNMSDCKTPYQHTLEISHLLV